MSLTLILCFRFSYDLQVWKYRIYHRRSWICSDRLQPAYHPRHHPTSRLRRWNLRQYPGHPRGHTLSQSTITDQLVRGQSRRHELHYLSDYPTQRRLPFKPERVAASRMDLFCVWLHRLHLPGLEYHKPRLYCV